MDSGSTQEARKEDQQVKKRKRQRPAEDTENRQAVDRHREQASGGQTQRTGKQWTDTENRQAVDRHTDSRTHRQKKKNRGTDRLEQTGNE